MTWAQAIAAVAPRVTWVHHGRDPDKGMDCVGLILCVYRIKGIDLFDLDVPYSIRDYQKRRRAGLVVERLLRRFREVPLTGALEDGDVLVTRCDRAPSHLAIVVGDWTWQMTAQGLYRMRPTAVLRYTEKAFRYGSE